MKFNHLAVASIIGAFTTSSHASVLIYEGFDYGLAEGTTMNGVATNATGLSGSYALGQSLAGFGSADFTSTDFLREQFRSIDRRRFVDEHHLKYIEYDPERAVGGRPEYRHRDRHDIYQLPLQSRFGWNSCRHFADADQWRADHQFKHTSQRSSLMVH